MTDDLPPSATLVLKVLEYRGPLTYSELLDEADIKESTLDDALEHLLSNDLVDRQPVPSDRRSYLYVTTI